MKRLIHRSVLLVAIAVLSVPGIRAEAIEVAVDCDAGESLARALRHAKVPPGGRRGRPHRSSDGQVCVSSCGPEPLIINIAGTCVANLVVNRDNVTIRGASPETAILEGVPDAAGRSFEPVIKAAHVQGLALQNLTIRKADTGVLAESSEVSLRNCHLMGLGIITRGGSLSLEASSITQGAVEGFVVDRGARALVVDSVIIGAETADVTVVDHSTVLLEGGEISSVEVFRSSYAGIAHNVSGLHRVLVSTNSQALVNTSVTNDVDVVQDSFAAIQNGTIGGNVNLYSFSRAQLLSETVTGAIVCEPGADATCLLSSVGAAIGCANCVVDTAPGSVQLIATTPGAEDGVPLGAAVDFRATVRDTRGLPMEGVTISVELVPVVGGILLFPFGQTDSFGQLSFTVENVSEDFEVRVQAEGVLSNTVQIPVI